MSERWPGGLISKTPVTPSGSAYNATAPGIWTIDQMNYWKSRGLWPDPAIVPDPYWSYVSYLMSTTAANAQQNNTFLDSSTNNFTITRVGNTTQGSVTPYGTLWSNYFPGSGYIYAASGTAQGTGDFTIEGWFNVSDYSTGPIFYDARPNSTNGAYIAVALDTPGYLSLYVNSAYQIQGATAVVRNTWNHFALTRSGTSTKLFLNGVQQGSTYTDTNNYLMGASRPIMAGNGFVPGGASAFTGYISNIRAVNGTALYTSNFTPPTTPLTAISGTTLLTCQSNRFKDNSSANVAITASGAAQVTAFSPFILAYPGYTTATNGGSGYFNGSTDYLSLAGASAFSIATTSTPFTIEAWIYPTAAGGCIFSEQWTGSGNVAISLIMNAASGLETDGQYVTLGYYNGAWVTTRPTTPVPLNAWTHVAAVFTGSTSKIYYNGVDVTAASPITSWATAGNNGDGWYIGKRWDTPGAPYISFYSGYIAGFRFTNGTAVYTSAFTPPTTPPTAIANTALLCNFTNAGIYDAATNSDMVTVGNAQVSSAQAKYGTTSLYLDGTGDWLTTRGGDLFQFGTGDFTIECWLNKPSAANGPIIDARGSAVAAPYALYVDGSNYPYFYDGSVYTSTVAITNNQWNHIAVTRASGTLRIFVGGVQGYSGSVTTNLTAAATIFIGGQNFSSPATTTGYIDDLRITKGYARYTANFTPPTAALPVY